MGELLVGIGPEKRVVEPQDLGRARECGRPGCGVLGESPVADLDAVHHARLLDREVGHPDHHAVDGDLGTLDPARAGAAGVELGALRQNPVPHHLEPRRCHDLELHRRLVRRMVDRREPVVRAIGPVVGEDRASSVPADAQDEPVGGRAVIPDDRPAARSRRRAGVADRQRVALALEAGRRAVERDAVDNHRGAQVEPHGVQILDDRLVEDRRPAGDRSGPPGRRRPAPSAGQ